MGSASPSAGKLTWPAISTTDHASFGIDISGTGSVSRVQIKSRFGNVSMGATRMAALVYKQIPWSGFSLVLYQALAVQAHAWTVFWFYCSGSSLTHIYWESTTSSAVHNEPMQGTCTVTPATDAQVSWPAESMALPAPIRGFSANAALLEIRSAAPGFIVFENRRWTLYPFVLVDCSTTCGTPGWFELHSLMWDSTARVATFGILYFKSDQPTSVQFSYGLELPTLARVADVYLDAPWTHTP